MMDQSVNVFVKDTLSARKVWGSISGPLGLVKFVANV